MTDAAPDDAPNAASDAASDAAARIQSLIALTQSLSNLFERENILIANGRPDAVAPLQAEKKRLAAAYARSIRALADSRALMSGADASLLEELRAMTARFEACAARQKKLLERGSSAGAKTPAAPDPLNPSSSRN